MKVDIIVEHATMETLKKLTPMFQKIEKENPGVAVHVEVKMN